MSSFHPPIALAAPLARAMAVAALMGATALAGSVTAARAAAPLQLAQATAPASPSTSPSTSSSPAAPASQAAPQTQGGDTATDTKRETVDERITALHAALQITPQEEAKWDRVAQVMRDNAAAMQKLMSERDAQAGNVTAVQDLEEYAKFAEAHVTGLRKLTASFDTLYKAMPAAQKKVADEVFQNFGHHPAAAAHS